jgi:hypothetical protein
MIKINSEIADLLFKTVGYGNIGIFCDLGYAGDNEVEFVIFYKEEVQEIYLAHISEFEQEGVLIRLKNEK